MPALSDASAVHCPPVGAAPIITRLWPSSKSAACAKSYRVYQKKEGLWAAFTGLFHREYREVQAVRGIDLDVEQGEFVAFLGPNGAGKTTTLKLLSGVINPTRRRRPACWATCPGSARTPIAAASPW